MEAIVTNFGALRNVATAAFTKFLCPTEQAFDYLLKLRGTERASYLLFLHLVPLKHVASSI